MKRSAVVATIGLVFTLSYWGCIKPNEDDDQAIVELLNTSQYTGDNHTRAYGSQDSTVIQGGDQAPTPGTDGYDTIPFVRFRRYVPGSGISRHIEIQRPAYPGYPDTTALATITSEIYGELRTMFDTTTNPIAVWRKPFHDRAIRRVYLTKHGDRWFIRRVSPLTIRTVNPAYELKLDSLIATASSGTVFRLHTGDTLLTKEELPNFVPNDTVRVQVFLSSNGDSAWVFLHHGMRPRVQFPGWRRPYFKTGTFSFERTWLIGAETYDSPEVRPSIHDAIGWSTLWADTTAPYVATAWGIPYIVRNPNEAAPEE